MFLTTQLVAYCSGTFQLRGLLGHNKKCDRILCMYISGKSLIWYILWYRVIFPTTCVWECNCWWLNDYHHCHRELVSVCAQDCKVTHFHHTELSDWTLRIWRFCYYKWLRAMGWDQVTVDEACLLRKYPMVHNYQPIQCYHNHLYQSCHFLIIYPSKYR